MNSPHPVWNVAAAPHILVVGDLMLDRYTWGATNRVSPEAPVLVLEADKEEVRLGGASSVAHLLSALGARVTLAGVVGRDEAGQLGRVLLTDARVDSGLVLEDAGRPTTVKHRFVGRASQRHAHQILRVDHETRTPIDAHITGSLLGLLHERLGDFDAVVVSDYGKGVCGPDLLPSLLRGCAEHEIPTIVDPARTADHAWYTGATVLTPNRIEAARLTGMSVDSIEQAFVAGGQLCEGCGAAAVAVTLDRDGIALSEQTGRVRHDGTRPRDVYDITGAGDMVAAVMGYGLAVGADLYEAVQVANTAAGLQVERFGVTPVGWEEIHADRQVARPTWPTSKLMSLQQVERLAQQAQRAGQRVVLTNGCFDLLHRGHVTMLREARRLGDLLIVAINSDRSVRQLKGPTRPIIGEQDRAAMLSLLDCVQAVLVFEEQTPHALLSRIRPDVLVKGGTTAQIVGRELVEEYGGEVVFRGHVAGLSTTAILAAAAKTPGGGPPCD